MNICIDMRMIESSGIGTYLYNLVLRLIRDTDYNYYLLGSRRSLNKIIVQNKSINFVEFDEKIYSLKEQIYFTNHLSDIDLFWSPHYNIPIFYKGKLLVTVHDVFHLAMPKFVNGFHKKLYAKFMFSQIRKKADAILTVSEFSKKELNRWTKIESSKVYVTHNGVDESWFNVSRTQKVHDKPYFLFVGNVKPHKNLIRLLKAFESIKDEIPHDLIIIGKKEGFITGDAKVAEQAKLLDNRVHFTGYIEDDLLKKYMANAESLVFPSLYEGFGLPPLEAMACGTPVIVSNVASLPEVCGDAALYCNPHNVEDIADKMKLLIENPSLRESLRKKGLERARMFSWEKCARETLAVIEEVLSN
ncbi:glycosyl transferase [Caldalkalibacillus thermarum]|uniref:glycosyltransferase family 4 protein n=1 Tax=Caldalkalibacillus thermarum TaxID=296745 RepID=UPI001998F4AA|nr:glycosyltransferase family 1 protein [Caldalkalibacillus thermarum]GGK34159.1 glycosyl transferase [Caldalkalibacillus thermarum]